MTTGQKIAWGRKAKGMTQEQLAELLGVTRQSVSRWESDTVYPETEKLIRLAELLGLTCDQLLRDTEPAEPVEVPAAPQPAKPFRWEYEYKSRRTFQGLPLVHVHVGARPSCAARGIVAVGNLAAGVVSVGILSAGVVSLGVLSAGLLSLAAMAVGLLALGGIAVGGLAVGGLAFGWFAVGGLAMGTYAIGGCAIARDLAVGGYAKATVAFGDTAHGVHAQSPAGSWSREDVARAMERYLPDAPTWLRFLIGR